MGNSPPTLSAPPTKYPPTPLPEPRDPTTREELEIVRLWQDITYGNRIFDMARRTLTSAPLHFFPEELLKTSRSNSSTKRGAATKDISFDKKLRSLGAIENEQKEDQHDKGDEEQGTDEQSDGLDDDDDDDYTNNYFDDGEDYGGGGFDDGDDEPSFY